VSYKVGIKRQSLARSTSFRTEVKVILASFGGWRAYQGVQVSMGQTWSEHPQNRSSRNPAFSGAVKIHAVIDRGSARRDTSSNVWKKINAFGAARDGSGRFLDRRRKAVKGNSHGLHGCWHAVTFRLRGAALFAASSRSGC
jgi:hypothetical protein